MRRQGNPGIAILVGALLAGCVPGETDPTSAVDLAAPARSSLHVQIRDADGAPVAAWAVVAPGGRDSLAGPDGIAVFERMPAGSVSITARSGDSEGRIDDVEVGPSGVTSVELTLGPPLRASLAVHAVDPLGGPVSAATLFVDDVEVGATDAAGVADAEGIEGGPVSVRVEPAPPLLPWEGPITLEEGGHAEVAVVLAARPPDDARHVGSFSCGECHPGEVASWSQSAHGRARRTVSSLELDGPAGLAASFAAGDAVPAGPAGATVVVARSGPATWTAEVRDGAGASTGALPVIEAYGGHLSGVALVVDAGSQRRVLPAAWSLTEGWVAAWTDGWFDGVDLRADPTPEVSFDLSCAGCHATGYGIVEVAAGWELTPREGSAVEARVGCEACHGPGSAHPVPTDGRALRIHQPRLAPPAPVVAVCSSCHLRVESDSHPFTAPPGPPTLADGGPPPPWAPATEAGPAAPDVFPTSALSRSHRDQVGAFSSSPHAIDWVGACTDCHAAHGSPYPASLRAAPEDPALCTSCHRSAFPDAAAIAAHANHPAAQPSCVDCHLARSGVVLSRDPSSGVGESRDHGLRVPRPEEALAAFDLVGVSTLPVDDVPVTPCFDCHARTAAAGDPTQRATWVDEVDSWAAWEANP